ncbi:glycosyltransferase family 39 protein [Iamia sp. SCSIO 61187]|uniref:glycosyltransferase family 39 protein n=1 Tax=Iamia sp. SCSIO 61187 TaxID=2722752 RepID=UPI001C6330F9|nr:glycosyltransferase family 39 protein [Iamia sp. SCSIO 61187]QYG94651.1 glycosyltransferase family 39 protein [Iamia sp. SCSIO 61187]
MGEGRLPHVLSVGWAAIALAPITSGWSAIDRGWTPVGDNGMIAAGAADTFTSEIPLLGMPSSIGYYSGVHVRHPGPLGFWFLALPARVFGAPGYGLVLGCVVLSVACLALVALTLRRTTGPVLEAGFLAATALMILGVGEPLGPDLVLYGHADSVIGQLRLEGVDVRLVDEERENDYVLYDYRARHPATGEEAVHILLRVGTSAPPEGYRLLSSYDPAEPVESYEGYSVPLFFAVPTTVFVRIE